MNKEEIFGLESGDRLNMLIAESFFDWKPITDLVELKRLNGFLQYPAPRGWWQSGIGEKRYYAPEFSFSISEAWKVVEALQDSGFWVRISSSRDISQNKLSVVEVGKLPDCFGNPSMVLSATSGLSVPEMICKMALVAKLA